MRSVLGPVKRFVIFALFPVVRMYWRVAKPKTSGVKVVLRKGDEILLIRHSYQPHFWSFPGGSIKKGELPYDAAVRELYEELQIAPINLREVGVVESTSEGKHDTITVFSARTEDTPVIDEVELVEMRWFSFAQLPNLGPTARRILSCYNSQEH